MKTRLALLCTCLAVGLVAAGCGSDNKDKGSGGSGDSGKTAAPAADSGGSSGGKSASVELKGIAFNPNDVSVPVGGTVTWTNGEGVPHDVTKEGGPGPSFKSGPRGGMKEGDTFKYTFKTAGKFDYECTVHPNMQGTVTVK